MHIPEQYQETHPGVIERKEYFPSSDFYAMHQDSESYKRIIDVDLPHYQQMLSDNPFPEIVGRYEKVLSIGGGIPKIEACYLQAKKIDVIDITSDIYKDLIPYFKELYGVHPEINYIEWEQVDYQCVCFVHFLEHWNWEKVKEFILSQDRDIFIYMPNIEAAKSDNWYHFGQFKIDHNTFFTMSALCEYAESIGYQTKSKAYKDDMFIWLFDKK